jgi:pimeloyl-ACP methyl ester carboxylesterase
VSIVRRARERYGPYIRWKRDLVRRIKAGSAVVETGRGPVEYAMDGASGPCLSIMHGCPGGYDQTRALFGDLQGRGFRVLSWSRPGYIRTPLDAGRTFEEQAEVFTALLDSLGIEDTAVLAYSAGGPPAVHFAAMHPGRIRALILECSVSKAYSIDKNNLGEHIFFGHIMFNDPAMWLADVIANHAPALAGWAAIGMESTLEEDELVHLLKDIMRDERRVRILMDLFKSMSPARFRTKGMANDLEQLARADNLPLGGVAAPTLIIHGTDDHDVPVEHALHAAAAIPAAELHLVEGGFHILALSEKAHEVNGKRLSFLRSHADAP